MLVREVLKHIEGKTDVYSNTLPVFLVMNTTGTSREVKYKLIETPKIVGVGLISSLASCIRLKYSHLKIITNDNDII